MPTPDTTFPGKDLPGQYSFLSIDGGVIDNEPFEYARYALMTGPLNGPLAGNKQNGDTADRAVIMIDPFPEPPDFPAPGKPDPNLVSIVIALFPMLKV